VLVIYVYVNICMVIDDDLLQLGAIGTRQFGFAVVACYDIVFILRVWTFPVALDFMLLSCTCCLMFVILQIVIGMIVFLLHSSFVNV